MIQSVTLSGSSVEGLEPTNHKSPRGSLLSSSDLDYMLQLGPVHWEGTDAVCGGSQETTAGSEMTRGPTSSDPGRQDDEAVPRLRVASTDNPGFVLLYQVKEEECKHQDEHLFSGESLRQLIKRFFLLRDFVGVTSCGPATNVGFDAFFGGLDMVPCLRASWWPSEEFFQRSRARDWPPAAVRDDIRQFGIHLVPVGAKGSSTEQHEFRVSFSRAEAVCAWHLLPPERCSLIALKTCKTALGPEGKPVKSYYMKTALFWLCQDSDVNQWTSIKQGMLMIIDYLERAIDSRYLGCFFWSEINLFRPLSPADLAAMRHTLSLLRRNMTRLLAHGLSSYIEMHLAPIILREPCQQLSERQLRVCLARGLMCVAVLTGFTEAMLSNSSIESSLIPTFLRSASVAELAVILHRYRLQNYMFLALTMAPADVLAQCRLTSLGDDMYSWDTAPLMDLLTHEDLMWLLGNPGAVHAWLQVRERLPAGLGSPGVLADILLNPPRRAEVLRHSVPYVWTASMQAVCKVTNRRFPGHQRFEVIRRRELAHWLCYCVVAFVAFWSLPCPENQWAVSVVDIRSRERARQFLDDPRTRAEHDRLRRSLPDPWRLRQFVFTDSQ